MGSNHKKKRNRSSSPSYRDKTRKNKSELKDKRYDNGKERDRSPSIPKYSKKTKSQKKKKEKYSNDSEVKLLKKLEDEREKMKVDHKKKKELMKALEMPEEKRLRRLNKKEAKERKRKEKMGWDNEYLHFTNDDNPYGDNNLLDTFVWKKKLEKEGLCSLSKEEIQQQSRVKMEENRVELEKVKKRRQERELEREERDQLMEMQTRQREAAQFSHFSSQEDIFQLEQARMRSQIRITDGRAKPIDLLAQYATAEKHMTAADVTEPHAHLTGLTLADLEDLLEDIKVYQQLEKKDSNQSYWNDLTTIVVDEVRRLRQRDPVASSSASADTGSARHGIHASIASDVSKIFQNKSVKELHQLRTSIERKLAGPTAGLDVGYWESLLSQLKAHQARARLRERHRDNLRKKLQMLKAEQGVKEEPQLAEESESSDSSSNEDKDEDTKEQEDRKRSASDSEELDESAMIVSTSVSAYNSGRFSPKLLSPSKLEPGTVCVDPQEDEQRLAWKRSRIVGAKGLAAADTLTPEEKAMHQQMQNTISSDDAQFSVEVRLDPQQHLWADKYRPRKPRYFNRVHTGFEWNKYNQTHYDMDNPPPKIVQGYKFNIFYPDLIERKKPPQYDLIPCDENRDFALLRFSSGPPYEDIAFKIVNREWEYSYKRGFRCQFHNNIFQLWFHFKRYRYRR